MTDLYVTKPIVKLPSKGRQSILITNNNNNMIQKPMEKNKYQHHLVSERLYVKVPSTITENDIILLLQPCQPQNVELTPSSSSNLSTGYISFPNKDLADYALTLFNGATFKNKNNVPIKLYIQSNGNHNDELQPMADILQACDLPSSTTNQSLYDLFRPFGPLALCKIIMDFGTKFNGTAMIRYYNIKDSDDAISSMNNNVIQGNTIRVFPFVSSKQQNGIDTEPIMKTTTSTTTTTTSTLINSPSLSKGGDPNSIDYTNLYIKNLDLNVKSSDLFNHFRKYGRIISARVMKNTDTKVSKGFGFVSFSTSAEASNALRDMDGQYILNKPIQVAFHEPKKSRNDTTTSSPPLTTNIKPSIPYENYNNNHSSIPSNGSPLPIKQHNQPSSSPLINQYNNTPKLSTSNNTSIPNSSTNITSKTSSFSPPLPQQPFYQQRQQSNNNHTNHNNNNNNNHSYHQYNNNSNIPSNQQDIFQSKSYQKKQPHLTRNKSSNQSLSDNILQNGFTVEKNSRGLMDYHQQIKSNGRSIPTDEHSNHSYGISSPPLPSSLSSSLPSAYNYRSNHISNNTNNITSTNNNNNNSNSNHFQPSLSTLASGATIQSSPYSSVNNNQQQKSSIKPTLRRRGSIESICSVVTETSSHAQRQKMIKAVQENSIVPQDQLDDIIDMLLTLKKKERSLCLFNPDFLKSKIQQALDALALTMDDDSDEDSIHENDHRHPISSTTNTIQQQQQNKKSNHLSPSLSPNLQNQYQPITPSSPLTNNDMNSLKRKSHAIPIVAPITNNNNNTITTTTTTVNSPKSNNISTIEIDEFLSSIENLSTLEKKQKLGDKLFPLVKATGIKHAPKVTIRLLDNIVLKELAYIMNDQVKLQSKIDYVMSLP